VCNISDITLLQAINPGQLHRVASLQRKPCMAYDRLQEQDCTAGRQQCAAAVIVALQLCTVPAGAQHQHVEEPASICGCGLAVDTC
jgi:hypothetical protein